MPGIVTEELTKKYGTTSAVNELSLSIPAGEIYGFLGPNGAGKTTTMRMLTGLLKPTSGSARVANVDITNRDDLRGRIGYLPEEPPIYEHATAYEQLEYIAGLRDLPSDTMGERIDTLLEDLDLTDDASKRMSEYSKGMRQKVAYIQAVMHQPDVIFLDEPTAGLDPRASRTIRTKIRDLAGTGTTVFLSTHILPVVEEVADTIGILHRGELIVEDSPDVLTNFAETGKTRALEDVFLELTTSEHVPSNHERDN